MMRNAGYQVLLCRRVAGKLIGHDGYEFMGKLYSHRFTDWLNGIPWYFYHLFLVVKLPLLTVAGFLVGLPLLFRRKLGDGRYFILLWMFLWMMTFSFGGGKFTRYFTTVLPAVLITSAIGVQTVCHWLGRRRSLLGFDGRRAGTKRSTTASSRPEGVRSSSTVRSSAPEEPSTAEWCTFE